MYRSIVRAAVTGFRGVAGSNLVLADDLTALNDAARAVYGKGRAALLAAADPVIIVAFDDLILHHNKQRISAGFTPPVYHRLKELAHLPLGIFGALVPIATGAVADSNWREDLAMLEAAAVAAQDEVDAIVATPATKSTAKSCSRRRSPSYACIGWPTRRPTGPSLRPSRPRSRPGSSP